MCECEQDYCLDCPGLYEILRLIDALVNEIRHLEAETVSTRYELAQRLPSPYGRALLDELVSNLAGTYGDYPAYQIYMKWLHNGQDPMESDDWVNQIQRSAQGKNNSLYLTD